jgi:hypothetical protein
LHVLRFDEVDAATRDGFANGDAFAGLQRLKPLPLGLFELQLQLPVIRATRNRMIWPRITRK